MGSEHTDRAKAAQEKYEHIWMRGYIYFQMLGFAGPSSATHPRPMKQNASAGAERTYIPVYAKHSGSQVAQFLSRIGSNSGCHPVLTALRDAVKSHLANGDGAESRRNVTPVDRPSALIPVPDNGLLRPFGRFGC